MHTETGFISGTVLSIDGGYHAWSVAIAKFVLKLPDPS